jgi:restriction system protein
MAIPDFQSLILPLLQLLSDGQEHTSAEVMDHLATSFRLSDAERRELLPSGTQARFTNRIAWAKAHLKKALLLESTGRGTVRITQRGQSVLKENPPVINRAYLRRFPEFMDFRRPVGSEATMASGSATKTSNGTGVEPAAISNETPAEAMGNAYETLRHALALELQDRIRQCSPRFFEKLVVDLLVAMGYGGSHRDAGQAVGQSGDGGIDGFIKEDKLGLDVVYIQAKRWEANVGRPIVQAFAGSLDGQRARKGVLITTSHFSQDAKDYVNRIEKKIVLIDGDQLAQHMIDHGVGVAEVDRYVVHQIDSDYFTSE